MLAGLGGPNTGPIVGQVLRSKFWRLKLQLNYQAIEYFDPAWFLVKLFTYVAFDFKIWEDTVLLPCDQILFYCKIYEDCCFSNFIN